MHLEGRARQNEWVWLVFIRRALWPSVVFLLQPLLLRSCCWKCLSRRCKALTDRGAKQSLVDQKPTDVKPWVERGHSFYSLMNCSRLPWKPEMRKLSSATTVHECCTCLSLELERQRSISGIVPPRWHGLPLSPSCPRANLWWHLSSLGVTWWEVMYAGW